MSLDFVRTKYVATSSVEKTQGEAGLSNNSPANEITWAPRSRSDVQRNGRLEKRLEKSRTR